MRGILFISVLNNLTTSYCCFQELTALLRSMGQNPTDSEVNDMINEVDVEGSGVVNFEVSPDL